MNAHRVSHKAPKVSRNGGKPPLTAIPEAKGQRCYKCGLQSPVSFDYKQGRWPAYWACHDCGSLVQPVVLTEQPLPIPEIQIRRGPAYIREHQRFESRWLICIGSHYVPTPFESSNPWTTVAFWIQTQAQGPVNVIATGA